jgi:iron complex outermembrane receptor protein
MHSPAQAETSRDFTMERLLAMSLEELIEVEVVLATRNPLPVHKAPAIASVVTERDIRNMGARTLLDVLRIIPGLGVSIAPIPVFHSIEVRGIKTLFSEKVLLMIDGHTTNDAMQSSSAHKFEYMSVEKIKRIEVIRGPGSALYGANAFAAVINVVTKTAVDINGLQLTAGGGSFDTQHYNILFGHTHGKLKITGSIDYLDTDGPSSFVEQDVIGNSGDTLMWQERPDVNLNLSYGDFILSGGYIENRMGPYIGASSALNKQTEQEWAQYWADLQYKATMTEQLSVKARLYGYLIESDPYWELFPPGMRLGPYLYSDGMIGYPASKHWKLGGEITTDYSLADHLITAGIFGEHVDQYEVVSYGNFHPLTYAPLDSFQPIASFNQEVTRDIWALYIQDVWNILDNLSLTIGLRHDNYSDFGGTTNPRAGLVWELADDTSLKLLYGSAFRAPGFAELYHSNNPSLVGNPQIEPEEIETYEAGVEHHFLNKYALKFNYYYNKISELIVEGPKTSPIIAPQYVNQGEATVEGVEVELKAEWGNEMYGFINYSYADPRDDETDNKLPDVAEHRVNVGINVEPWKYLNGNVTVSWIGERTRADEDIRDDLSPSTLVDVTLIGKNFYKSLEIRGSVHNLFDENYRDPSPFPGPVPNDHPTNERILMVEFRYTF